MNYEPVVTYEYTDDIDEKRMLDYMKREQELGGSLDEQNNLRRPVAPNQYEHQVYLIRQIMPLYTVHCLRVC